MTLSLKFGSISSQIHWQFLIRFLQTANTSTIHKLHGESARLLKTILSFFIERANSDDLTSIDYADSTNHLLTQDVYIGDSTTALAAATLIALAQ